MRQEIIKLLDKQSKIKLWATLIDSIRAYVFIHGWVKRYGIQFRLKYKIRLSVHTALVLYGNFTKNNLQTFFSGIALVRYWDDFYDKKMYSVEDLKKIRQHVLHGIPSGIEQGGVLRRIFLDIVSPLSNVRNDVIQSNLKELLSALERLLDGFEYEHLLITADIDLNTESVYLKHASQTIGLPYVIRLMALLIVRTPDDQELFNQALDIEKECAESIRLANDIAGHWREVVEGKVDMISIKEQCHSISTDDAVEDIYRMLYNRLIIIDQSMTTPSHFDSLMKRITFFAVKQYLKAGFLYRS